MPPIDPLSLILSETPELYQGIKGIFDVFTGDQFGNAKRPLQSVPTSVAQATALARSQASSPILPGSGLIGNQIAGNTGAGIHALTEGGGSGAAFGANVGNLVNKENTQFQNLEIEGVNRQDKNRDALGRQLNTQGEYEQKAWDFNYKEPYEYAQKAANTFTQGGLGEIFNSLKGGGQTYMLLDMLAKLKKGNNGGAAPGTGGNANSTSYADFPYGNDPSAYGVGSTDLPTFSDIG